MVRLSRVRKLDNIRSWSLEAVTTCPGARDEQGGLVEVCRGCYATDGHYHMTNVKDVRRKNREDWQRESWVQAMTHELDNDRYFRWFDSGDIYHPKLALKILAVVQNTPWCQHWIPTRSYKIPRIRVVLEAINNEPNAVVRYSADNIDEYQPDLHGAIVTSDGAVPDGARLCPAWQHSPAKCNGCRACWDKSVKTIAYPAHGRKMRTVLKDKYGYFALAA